MLARIARKIDQHFHFSGRPHVKPVCRLALLENDRSPGKRRIDHALADRPQLRLLHAGKQFQLAQVDDALLDLAVPKRFPVRLVLLGHVHRLFRHGQTHSRALQRGEHVHADGGVGRIVGLGVDHPVAQCIARVPGTKLHQHARGSRVARHIRDVGRADHLFDLLNHQRRW